MLRTFQNFLDRKQIQSSFYDDQHTMIQFTIENINYLFVYESTDSAYIRIIIPNAGALEEQDEHIRMLYNLTMSYKLGKAYVLNNQVWFSTDAFVYDRENIDQLFERMISILRDMLNQYRTSSHA